MEEYLHVFYKYKNGATDRHSLIATSKRVLKWRGPMQNTYFLFEYNMFALVYYEIFALYKPSRNRLIIKSTRYK